MKGKKSRLTKGHMSTAALHQHEPSHSCIAGCAK